MYGAKPFHRVDAARALSASRSVSLREEGREADAVIHTYRHPDAKVRLFMSNWLLWKSDARGHRFHCVRRKSRMSGRGYGLT